MKRSTDRILTTHVGSLARPHELLDTMKERENGRPYDAELLDRQITEAVADRVRQQVESGIDIVTDGEMSKVSFLGYVKDRLGGFELDVERHAHGPVVAEGGRRLPRVLRRLLQEVLGDDHPAAAHRVQGRDQLHRSGAAANRHRQPQGGGRRLRRRRRVHAVDGAERVRAQRVLRDARGVPRRRGRGDARGVPGDRRGRVRAAGRRPVPHRPAQRSDDGGGRAGEGGMGSRRGAQPRPARTSPPSRSATTRATGSTTGRG